MKEVVILLLVTLTLSGCSSTPNVAATTASGSWQAQLSGGTGPDATGFSFITSFNVDGSGGLSVTYFQFITAGTCFVSGETEGGTLVVTTNSSGTVTGTLAFTVTSGTPSGNTLTLNGTESGTTITGTWQVSGTSSCTSSGTFTMTQS